MGTIKRWTSGLFSRVDWIVSQVENHEALVNNAIRNARESSARAKVQLGRVIRDGENLRNQLNNENEALTRWRERAKQQANIDEKRAIECLRRAKRTERVVAELKKRLEEHIHAEQQLSKDVQIMEEKLNAMIEKRNLMRTRQSRAEAVQNIQYGGDAMGFDLDDIFERWEIRVTESELGSDCGVSKDSLENHFVSAEEEVQLREELKRLIQEDN